METDVGKLETQLAAWRARIARLAAVAAKAGAGARIELHQQIDDLKARVATAQAKFDAFNAAPIAKQASFKTGVDKAWNEVEAAFADLKR